MLRKEDSHASMMELVFVVEGERKKGRPKSRWVRLVLEGSMKVGLM